MFTKKSAFLLPVIVAITFGGCAPYAPTPELTQLQIRELETRQFDTQDTKMVMKTMLNVLQDEGFVIKNAVSDLGLISAEKNIDIADPAPEMEDLFFNDPNSYWAKQQNYYWAKQKKSHWAKQETIEVSANVSEYGTSTRVRINFSKKTLDNFGRPMKSASIRDPKYYQEFFEKVSKGIFIQEENI